MLSPALLSRLRREPVVCSIRYGSTSSTIDAPPARGAGKGRTLAGAAGWSGLLLRRQQQFSKFREVEGGLRVQSGLGAVLFDADLFQEVARKLVGKRHWGCLVSLVLFQRCHLLGNPGFGPVDERFGGLVIRTDDEGVHR